MRPSGCACVTSGSIKILDTPLQTDYKERNFWSLNQWNNRCRDKRRCLALCVHKTTKIVFLSEVSGFSLGISSHGIWLPQLRPRPPWHSLCFSDLRRTKFFHEKITLFEKEKNWSSICVYEFEKILSLFQKIVYYSPTLESFLVFGLLVCGRRWTRHTWRQRNVCGALGDIGYMG